MSLISLFCVLSFAALLLLDMVTPPVCCFGVLFVYISSFRVPCTPFLQHCSNTLSFSFSCSRKIQERMGNSFCFFMYHYTFDSAFDTAVQAQRVKLYLAYYKWGSSSSIRYGSCNCRVKSCPLLEDSSCSSENSL